MPNIERHNPGSFCWFELATTDQPAAKQFYTSLFGWSVNEFPMGPSDVYTMFQLGGRDVGAAYTLRPDQRAQGIPPHWMVYVAVTSADEAARRALELGGKVYAPPFDVAEHGRMAVLADPTGAVFSVWQAKAHSGVGISGIDGTVCWADLSTPDVDKAREFYSDLFDWKIAASERDSSGYLHIRTGEEYIGGIPPSQYRQPGLPPHWMVYFSVPECTAATEKAMRAGAQVIVEPMSIEHVGRMSIIKDPQGAIFSLFEAERK